MRTNSGVTIHKGAAALVAVALTAAGAGATLLFMRTNAKSTRTAIDAESSSRATSSPAASAGPSDALLPDIIIPLSPDAAARAGIVVASVATHTSAAELRLPGVVEPNAYRQVVVTPLVAGRVTRVGPALGDHVRKGQSLAEIYSPALAEAQTAYISAEAMLAAHDRELQRTEKLVEIGAASQQELERIHAEHAAQTAAVQSARAQLELLGVSASALEYMPSDHTMTSTISVPAPINGVITERGANVGLNADQATTLFTVVDLSTVWVVADLYERDLSRVRVGTEATITTSAQPDRTLRGRVSYIDPQISAGTRTARVRFEVPNPGAELRLGMYADVVVASASGASTPSLPRSAVQHVGDRTVVYLTSSTDPETFVEREVRLGEASGEQIEVISGVQPGDMVVTGGSFFLRAERERLGLRAAAPPRGPAPASGAGGRRSSDDVQTATIVVSEQGYEPASVTLQAGRRARLIFMRMTDKTCGTDVVFPSLNIKRALPLNEPAVIEFTPAKSGDIAFACGMNMLHGNIVVE